MHDQELTQDEFGTDLEADSFEFETGEEFAAEEGAPASTGEEEEMKLATELLAVSSEEEMDQFLGKLFKGVWKGLKKIARPLGGLLKGIAKKALPFLGGALGSFIPIPGVGTALGSAIGGAASKLLEVDLEAMSPEDQEFELARRFVRLARNAAARAADDHGSEGEFSNGAVTPTALNAVAFAAVRDAARQLNVSPAVVAPGRQPSKQNSGRWLRRGHQIVLLGA